MRTVGGVGSDAVVGIRRGSRLGLAAIALVGVSGLVASSASVASASQHKKAPKHKTSTKASTKTPCLVGDWTATTIAVNEGGVTASGGAGTEVDIAANTSVVGNFTPGAPLTGGKGTVKFSGTDYGNYGFSPKTTATSGTFPVTYTSASDVTISVDGSPPVPTAHTTTTGSYVCAGGGLTLSFPAGGNELVYTLVRSK